MKPGTWAMVAALATAMTLGSAVTAADAGSMSKKRHGSQGHVKTKRVYIDPNISTQNLRRLHRQLQQNNQHRAVRKRIEQESDERTWQNLQGAIGIIQLGIGGGSRGRSGGGHR